VTPQRRVPLPSPRHPVPPCHAHLQAISDTGEAPRPLRAASLAKVAPLPSEPLHVTSDAPTPSWQDAGAEPGLAVGRATVPRTPLCSPTRRASFASTRLPHQPPKQTPTTRQLPTALPRPQAMSMLSSANAVTAAANLRVLSLRTQQAAEAQVRCARCDVTWCGVMRCGDV
jgi:hypothetical protein